MFEAVHGIGQRAACSAVSGTEAGKGKGAGGALDLGEESRTDAVGQAGFNGDFFLVSNVGGEAGLLAFPGAGGGLVEDRAKAGDEAVTGEDEIGGGAPVRAEVTRRPRRA